MIDYDNFNFIFKSSKPIMIAHIFRKPFVSLIDQMIFTWKRKPLMITMAFERKKESILTCK